MSRAIGLGLDVQTLRDSAAAREALQAAARQAGDVLAELVQTGRRAISLGGGPLDL